MDFLDVLTPIHGDWVDFIQLYISCGHSGQFRDLNRTEEVRGSSPLRSTLNSSRSVFCYGDYVKSLCFLPLTISRKSPINVDCNLDNQGCNQVKTACIIWGNNNQLILNYLVMSMRSLLITQLLTGNGHILILII